MSMWVARVFPRRTMRRQIEQPGTGVMEAVQHRFVLLRHEPGPGFSRTGETHWDLMLQEGGALKTWALERPPTQDSFTIDATAISDHRLDYLDFEGALTGNRGVVRREDQGFWTSILVSDCGRDFQLEGEWLRGRFRLKLTTSSQWQFSRLG